MWDFVSVPYHSFIQYPFNTYLPNAFFVKVLSKLLSDFLLLLAVLPSWGPVSGMGIHSHR